MKLKIVEMEKVIYKLMNEKSPHSQSTDYRGKYKAEK
jgi:hypothetical protein